MQTITIPSNEKKNETKLIHFHSESSPRSKIQLFVMKNFNKIKVETQNIDNNKNIFDSYNILTVPTIIFIANGYEVARWETNVSYENILNVINSYL